MWSPTNPKPTKAAGEVIKSGHDPAKITGLSKLKSDFVDGLTLKAADANVETINEYATKEGAYRGFNALLKRASKMKLNTARGAVQTMGTVLQHAQGAAQSELQYEQQAARFLERYSETLVDLNITQSSHSGFASYLHTADDLIKF